MSEGLENIVSKMGKEFGSENVRLASQTPKIEAISTGIPSLDYALGIGGYPKGGITMVFGPENVGKSVLSYMAIAEVQRAGGYAALVDLEGGLDPEFAPKFGVDLDKLIVTSPTSAEDTRDHAIMLANEPSLGLIVVDSIGAMASEKELDEEGKKQAYGQSGIITHMVKQLLPRVAKNKQVCLLLNQIRDTANRQGLPIVHAPGGHALRHACALIIQMKPGNDKKNHKFENEKDAIEVGFRPIATVTKSKVSPPKRVAEWDFYHTDSPVHPVGVNVIGSTVDVATRLGLITRGGAWYTCELLGMEKTQGIDKVYDWFSENKDSVDKLRKLIFEELQKDKD